MKHRHNNQEPRMRAEEALLEIARRALAAHPALRRTFERVASKEAQRIERARRRRARERLGRRPFG